MKITVIVSKENSEAISVYKGNKTAAIKEMAKMMLEEGYAESMKDAIEIIYANSYIQVSDI